MGRRALSSGNRAQAGHPAHGHCSQLKRGVGSPQGLRRVGRFLRLAEHGEGVKEGGVGAVARQQRQHRRLRRRAACSRGYTAACMEGGAGGRVEPTRWLLQQHLASWNQGGAQSRLLNCMCCHAAPSPNASTSACPPSSASEHSRSPMSCRPEKKTGQNRYRRLAAQSQWRSQTAVAAPALTLTAAWAGSLLPPPPAHAQQPGRRRVTAGRPAGRAAARGMQGGGPGLWHAGQAQAAKAPQLGLPLTPGP